MKKSDQAIEIETGPSPDATVIWLHGLGADGNDFVPVVPALRLPKRLAVRFIFPHAPVRPITFNMGMPMRAWFDIVSLDGLKEDAAGIRATQRFVEQIIGDEVARGIAPRRIVLAGDALEQGIDLVLREDFVAHRHGGCASGSTG